MKDKLKDNEKKEVPTRKKVLNIILKIVLVIGVALLVLMAFKLPIMQGLRNSGILNMVFASGEVSAEVLPISKDVFLPEVTGKYQVGRTKMNLVDYSRYDFYKKDISRSGCYELMVKAYYPTNEKGIAESYVSDDFSNESTSFLVNEKGESPFSFIHQNALDDATCAMQEDGFPVVIFAPGGSWPIEVYSYIFEEWASHGYVVFALTDPLSSPLIELEDGSAFNPSDAGISDFMLLSYSNVKSASNMLNYYLDGANSLDIMFVVNQLNSINKNNEILSGALDLDTVIAAGHSIGGASAAKASLITDAIDGVIIYDSYLFHVLDKADPYLTVPSLFFITEGIDNDEEGQAIVDGYNKENMTYLNGSGRNTYHMLNGSSHASIMVDLILSMSYEDAEKSGFIKDVDSYELSREIIDESLSFMEGIN